MLKYYYHELQRGFLLSSPLSTYMAYFNFILYDTRRCFKWVESSWVIGIAPTAANPIFLATCNPAQVAAGLAMAQLNSIRPAKAQALPKFMSRTQTKLIAFGIVPTGTVASVAAWLTIIKANAPIADILVTKAIDTISSFTLNAKLRFTPLATAPRHPLMARSITEARVRVVASAPARTVFTCQNAAILAPASPGSASVLSY